MVGATVVPLSRLFGRLRALTTGKGTFEMQREFSEAPSPSKGLLGAFGEALKGDPGPSLGASFARSLGDHSVQLAAANYRAKTLERENAALRERNEELATFLQGVEDRVTAARDAAERRIGDLLASNNAMLARARAAEAALRPLAAFAKGLEDDEGDNLTIMGWQTKDGSPRILCTAGHVRAAAAVLAKIDGAAS